MIDILQFLKIMIWPLIILEGLSMLYELFKIIVGVFFSDEKDTVELKVDWKIFLHTFSFAVCLGVLLI